MSDYTFSTRVHGSMGAKRLIRKRMEKERAEWMRRAEKELERYKEDVSIAAGDRWARYYKEQYDRDITAALEKLHEDSKAILENQRAEFEKSQASILEEMKAAVADQAREELEQKYEERFAAQKRMRETAEEQLRELSRQFNEMREDRSRAESAAHQYAQEANELQMSARQLTAENLQLKDAVKERDKLRAERDYLLKSWPLSHPLPPKPDSDKLES